MRSYSLPELAEECAVSPRTIEAWIASGELRAINVSRNRSSRKPRLRVLQSDLDAFFAGRATNQQSTTDQQTARRPRQRRIEVEQFV